MAGRRSTQSIGTMMNVSAEPQIKRRTGRAHPPMTKVRSAAPSARPGGLDNVGGGLDARGYSQTPVSAQAFESSAAGMSLE
jgi:hypothetical protein